MKPLAWLHPDCLNAHWLPAGAPAVYVFDDAFLAEAQWSLKRVGFVYETLLELPVEIHHGPAAATLIALARAAGATRIVTVDSPDPWFLRTLADLQRALPVDVLPAPDFVDLDSSRLDLKRFSRYWNRAEGKLLA